MMIMPLNIMIHKPGVKRGREGEWKRYLESLGVGGEIRGSLGGRSGVPVKIPATPAT